MDDLSVDDFISKLKDNTLILQNKDVLLDRLKNNESAYGILIIMNGVKMLNDKNLFDEGGCYCCQQKN
ncbi:hypothetical protein [Chryseobacterium vaccae]|uniref:hypothetical protein n=1 Tax=Chryseobacterium vaccae TaxID=2604424 RepID=UPI001295B550|nr:hypothetical protein [Chryseobacterium vaccae]